MTPSKPSLTEKNLPDQQGKVFIVTGGTSGVGKELVQILYQHNARVYIAARSSQKAAETIQWLKEKHPQSKGSAVYLSLNLDDLTTIRASAQEFLSKETRLDVLWNNAGVMVPPQGSKTKQGYELQLGVNNLAPFLFTKLLTPILARTAETASAGSVRIVWVSSSASERFAPEGGIDMTNLDYHQDQGPWHKYGVSKAGNIFHATEFARRYGESGIISVPLDPGNLKTDLYKHLPWWQKPVINFVLKEPIYGAYTELYGGLSAEVSEKGNGLWIKPWGSVQTHSRTDIVASCKSKTEGGTGIAKEFWTWCDTQVTPYE